MKKKYTYIKNWGHNELFTILLDTLHTIWFVDKKNSPNLLEIEHKLYDTDYPIQKLDSLFRELNETERELVGLESKYINRDEFCKNILFETINSDYNFLFEETDDDDEEYDNIVNHYFKLFCENNKTTKKIDDFDIYFQTLRILFDIYYNFEESELTHKTISEIAKILRKSIPKTRTHENLLTEIIYDFHGSENYQFRSGRINFETEILDSKRTIFYRPKLSGKIIEKEALRILSEKGYDYKIQNKTEDLNLDISVYDSGDHIFDIECYVGEIKKGLKKLERKSFDLYFNQHKGKNFVFIFNGIWTIVFKGDKYSAYTLFNLPTLEEYHYEVINFLYHLSTVEDTFNKDGINYKKVYPNEIDDAQKQSLIIPKKKKSKDAGKSLDIFLKNLFIDKTVVLSEKEVEDAIYSAIMHDIGKKYIKWIRKIEKLDDFIKKEEKIDQLKNKTETSLVDLKKLIVNHKEEIEQNIQDIRDNPNTQDSARIIIDINKLKDCRNNNCEKCFKCIQKEFSKLRGDQIEKWANKKGITAKEVRRIVEHIKSAQFDIEIINKDYSTLEVKQNFLTAINNLIHNSFKHGYIDLPKRIAINTYANHHEISLEEAYKRLNDDSYDDIIDKLKDVGIDEKQFLQESAEIKLKLVIRKSMEDDKIYFIYSQNGTTSLTNKKAKDLNRKFWEMKRTDSDISIGNICGNYQTKRIIHSNGGEIWIVRPENFSDQFKGKGQERYLPYPGLTIMFNVSIKKL